MAVASLAAILKPQILCLMQANEEERRGKKKQKAPNQFGLLDMVTRRAAAMAQIRRWQCKLLQIGKAEKRLFFPLLSFFSNLSTSISSPTTFIGSASYTRCIERTAFSVLRSFVSRNANLAAQSIPGLVVGVRFVLLH